ncbi:MAG: DNA-directed RNA polymerase subunit omega [Vicinamibacterales bacterium]
MSDAAETGIPGSLVEQPEAPRAPAPPIQSRFLFVDVAAQRAKQLRMGARPRVEAADLHTLERLAMREVTRGTVEWELPAYKGVPANATT